MDANLLPLTVTTYIFAFTVGQQPRTRIGVLQEVPHTSNATHAHLSGLSYWT